MREVFSMKPTDCRDLFTNFALIKIGICRIDLKNRYFIELAFKGTHYFGWQIQPDVPTIQQVLIKALATVLRIQVDVTGAGRTDTGVHATRFYAHFDAPGKKVEGNRNLVFQLNGVLGNDIAIYGIRKVLPDAHARFSALSRTYTYTISRLKDPFRPELEYFYSGVLDMNKMNRAAGILTEYDDFTSFSKLHSHTETNLCKIMEAGWYFQGEKLVFTIRADRFLRNMVRAIVGTLIQVGTGKIEPEDLRRIIEAKDRFAAGPSAPARGLSLTDIEYPENIFV